ncbi:MAG: hypothetical protein O9972_00720, partial [Burkholderiales bacterium]|nr:hypothetical protein [Burkholderiales bacterium]
MARQDQNDAFLQTSFLYGANAAYIEDLHARWQENASSVDADWQAFFAALKDDGAAVAKTAKGASWKRPGWPVAANGELVSALDGNWGQVEKIVGDKIKGKAEVVQAKGAPGLSEADIMRATRDSVRALMMIRAYRMRGHLHAQLDPLEIEPMKDHEELHPSSYGFTEADWDRKIFIDHVLGLEYATIREMLAILKRTYCSTIGYEFMHISNPQEKAWIQERVEGPDKEIAFT